MAFSSRTAKLETTRQRKLEEKYNDQQQAWGLSASGAAAGAAAGASRAAPAAPVRGREAIKPAWLVRQQRAEQAAAAAKVAAAQAAEAAKVAAAKAAEYARLNPTSLAAPQADVGYACGGGGAYGAYGASAGYGGAAQQPQQTQMQMQMQMQL